MALDKNVEEMIDKVRADEMTEDKMAIDKNDYR
jgi:hypothetical protein